MILLKDAEIENTSYSLIGPKIRRNRTIFVVWAFRNHKILIFFQKLNHTIFYRLEFTELEIQRKCRLGKLLPFNQENSGLDEFVRR